MKKLLIALVAIALLGAAGTGLTFAGLAVADRLEERQASADRRADAAAESKERRECSRAVDDYVDALGDIDAATEVGVNLTEYGKYVREAASAKRRVDDVSSTCEKFAVDPLDESLKRYASAGSDWNDCVFEEYDCDPDDLDLSSDWSRASSFLERAESYLDGAGTTSGDET